MAIVLGLVLALCPADDVAAVRERARTALREGDLEQATRDYLWLWRQREADVPGWTVTRHHDVGGEIEDLVARHEPARRAFRGELAALEEAIDDGAARQVWADWLVLATRLEERDRVVAWIREHRDDDGRLATSGAPAPASVPREGFVRRELVTLLVEEGLAAEAGRLFDELGSLVDHDMVTLELLRASPRATSRVAAAIEATVRRDVAPFYGAALAAGRSDVADRIAGRLLEALDDAESRVALVRAALAAGASGPRHVRWLAEAEAACAGDGDLALRVDAVGRELRGALGHGGEPGEPSRVGAFTVLSFEEAAERAGARGEVLLLDFTATWCAPCRLMDRTTWADERVRSWIDEHGLALKIDTDEQRDLARSFDASLLPTVVLLAGDEERGRFTGYRDAEQVLAWMEGLVER